MESSTIRTSLAKSLAQAAWDQRQLADPIRTYQPHPKQQLFIDAVLRGDGAECWLVTANRFGKSDAIAYCLATLARYGVPATKPAVGAHTVVYDRAVSLWVIGPDWNTMQHTILPKILDNGMVNPGQRHAPFIPLREMDASYGTHGWHASKQVGKLSNGSILQAKSSEQDTLKFAAAGIDVIAFDEEPAKLIYEECGIRVEAGAQLLIFGGATLLPPEGEIGGVSWIYSDLIVPWQEGRAPHLKIFGGAIYDNPHIDGETLARLEAKYPPASTIGRIRLGGEYLADVTGSRKYPVFHRSLHVARQDEPDPYRPLCWCWDFNVTPFITLVAQRDAAGMFRFLHEFVLENGSIPLMVSLFREWYPQHPGAIWIYGDWTGHNRSHQTNETSYTLILNHMRTYPTPCQLKLPATGNPAVPDRVNAVNVALKNEAGVVCVAIDPQCEQLILDLQHVLDDGRGGIKKVSNPRDPYYWRTHASDEAGYFIAYEAPVVRRHPPSRAARRPIAVPRYSAASARGR